MVGKLGNYFFEWLDLSRDAFGPILNKTGSTPAGTFSFFICFSNKSPLNGLHTELRYEISKIVVSDIFRFGI